MSAIDARAQRAAYVASAKVESCRWGDQRREPVIWMCRSPDDFHGAKAQESIQFT